MDRVNPTESKLHDELDAFLKDPRTEKYDTDALKEYFAFRRDKRPVDNIPPLDEREERLAIGRRLVHQLRTIPGAETTNLTALELSVVLLMPLHGLRELANTAEVLVLKWRLGSMTGLASHCKYSYTPCRALMS